MFFMPPLLRIAFRNVKVYWRQSFAAIISVVAGFVAFIIFEGYLRDIYRAYTDFNERLEMYGDLIVEREGASTAEGRADPWDYSLTAGDQTLIQDFLKSHNSEIEAAARFLTISGSIDTSTASSIVQGIAYDVTSAAQLRGRWKWDTYWGKPLHESPDPERQILTGMRLARKLGCLPEKISGLERYLLDLQDHPQYRPFLCENEEFQISSMTEQGQINALDLSISGIQDKGFLELDNRYLVMSLPTAQKLFNTDKVSYYSVKMNDPSTQKHFIDDFNAFITTKAPHLKMIPWKDHPLGELYNKTMSLLDVIRNFLISIIVFIGAMSVFNTLVKLVKERTQEIGMLRSLGFRTLQIRQLFMVESILLSWLGCFLGTIISVGISVFFNRIQFTYPSGQFSFESPFHIEMALQSYFYGFLLMTLIAIFACWIAVRNPSKENVAKLLLHT